MKLNVVRGLLFSLLLLTFSCRPLKDLNYLQDIDKVTNEEAVKLSRVTLQEGDQLVINIMGRDQDVVAPFNQNYSSGQVLQNPQITGNASGSIPTASGSTYVVDHDGNIDMPILGRLHADGQTIDEFKSNLLVKLRRYIKEPAVSVRLNNFRISVMGEVNRPGEYVLVDGKGTFLSALSLAGDLTIFGKRDDIIVLRTVDGKLEKTKIDITNADFLNSPFYTLKQGDVIYVASNKTKQRTSRLDPNAGIYISVASIVVTILALVFRR